MPEVPKIVCQRLRASLPEGAAPEKTHPDPDVLTAFAERSLPTRERDGVLQHLARCRDCREWVSLSIVPLESDAQPVTAEESEAPVPVAGNTRRRGWFAWPDLRWAALAAGLLLAVGLLLIHAGKPKPLPDATQQPAPTITQSQGTTVAEREVPAPENGVKAGDSEKKPVLADGEVTRHKESRFLSSRSGPGKKAAARGQSRMPSGNPRLTAGPVLGSVVGGASSSGPPAPPVPSTSGTVEVDAASGIVTTEGARDELPVTGRPVTAPMIISKAKAAKTESKELYSLQEPESQPTKQGTDDRTAQQGAITSMNRLDSNLSAPPKQANLPQPPAHWAVHGNDLQRSFDSGITWTTALHSGRALLSYAASGKEIWVGGKAGDLFHSANGGLSWSQVHPLAQQKVLSDDVTGIELYGPSQVRILTANHQFWKTTDGGNTWENQ
jgi:hypothetical protein